MAEQEETEAASSRTTSSTNECENAEGTRKNDEHGDEERAFECSKNIYCK